MITSTVINMMSIAHSPPTISAVATVLALTLCIGEAETSALAYIMYKKKLCYTVQVCLIL